MFALFYIVHQIIKMNSFDRNINDVLMNLTNPYFQCRLIVIQRDTNGLANENTELKLRLQAMEQQAQLRNGIHSKSLIPLYALLVYLFLLLCGLQSDLLLIYSSKRSFEERS